jgi:hypothetical protein
VASAPANTTNDVSSKVALFGAVIFAMSDVAAVLADLVLVIAESAVEGSEFAELIAFVIVLAFGSGCSLAES